MEYFSIQFLLEGGVAAGGGGGSRKEIGRLSCPSATEPNERRFDGRVGIQGLTAAVLCVAGT